MREDVIQSVWHPLPCTVIHWVPGTVPGALWRCLASLLQWPERVTVPIEDNGSKSLSEIELRGTVCTQTV